MGGRGRGRGGGRPVSLNVEALGFGRGDALPTATLQPPPIFPPLERHALPMEHSEKQKYLIDVKRYLQTFMEDSPYHVKRVELKKDIQRYSDKYKLTPSVATESETILYSRMPEELRPRKDRKPKKKKKDASKLAVANTIQALEKKEGTDNKAGSGDEKARGSDDSSDEDDKEDGEELEEEMDEEDMEEDNDYIQGYFDNGETFGDGDDDGADEGPIY